VSGGQQWRLALGSNPNQPIRGVLSEDGRVACVRMVLPVPSELAIDTGECVRRCCNGAIHAGTRTHALRRPHSSWF
jgi:hypothetical protein